jgi:hypothetical protein
MEHIQKMPTKILLPPGIMDADDERDFMDPAQDLVHCKDDPSKIVPFVGLKPDANLYASEDSVKSDIREISGFSEILSGQIPFSRIAATTSAIMERNATLRFDFYSERVADFIIDTAKDLFKIVRLYQSYPQEVQVTGDPEPRWLEISSKELSGDFLFKLDIEDMSISSRQQRIKESYDLLVSLSQFPEVKRETLVRDFLLAAGKVDIADYMHPPAGPPLDPNYENQVMAQGYPVQSNQNEDFQLHIQVHTQFMQSDRFRFIVAQQPAIGNLFSEHMQQTTRMAQMQAMMNPQGGGGGGGSQVQPNPSMQQGQALAGSQPVGGSQSRAAAGLSQAISNAQRLR